MAWPGLEGALSPMTSTIGAEEGSASALKGAEEGGCPWTAVEEEGGSRSPVEVDAAAEQGSSTRASVKRPTARGKRGSSLLRSFLRVFFGALTAFALDGVGGGWRDSGGELAEDEEDWPDLTGSSCTKAPRERLKADRPRRDRPPWWTVLRAAGSI